MILQTLSGAAQVANHFTGNIITSRKINNRPRLVHNYEQESHWKEDGQVISRLEWHPSKKEFLVYAIREQQLALNNIAVLRKSIPRASKQQIAELCLHSPATINAAFALQEKII